MSFTHFDTYTCLFAILFDLVDNEDEMKRNKEWKVIAARIDDVARFLVPLAYFIAFAIVLAEVV